MILHQTPYAGKQIGQILRAAREGKSLAQRALSKKVGVTQTQISRIESGAVDPRLTSLIELSRALDLELMLVPRKLVPAVQGIVRGSDTSRPAYRLDEDETDG